MCGIAGYLHFERGRAADARLLARMTDRIHHRGPDDRGYYVKENAALGACRLSIIDLAGGRQPLSNEDGSCWVAYNGETYNHVDLRNRLAEAGHTFRTRCDTEVLVHAYEEWGVDFIKELDGMFGFALWDERRRRLILGRDRIGIKPLYYAVQADSVVFGSEIKSILEFPGIDRRADLHAVDNILTFEYNPSSRTVFAGILKVPPGHYLIAEEGGPCSLHQYWDLNGADGKRPGLSHAIERLTVELQRAVQSHLMSDVPLGVFLSGGMDSSCIVALMSRMGVGPVKTFSIGFRDKDYDELQHARAVAERFRTDHYELVLEPRDVEVLPDLVWHLEEPIADEAAVPLYFLSALAREHVKVVLVGDGGDELFGGYNRYFLYTLVGRYAQLPAVLRKGIVEPLVRVLSQPNGNDPVATLIRRAKKLVEVAYLPEETRFSTWNRILSDDLKKEIYAEEFLHVAAEISPLEYHQRHFRNSAFSDPMSRSQYVDIKSYLVDCLLMKSDKVTSAFSLEGRIPLLDTRLVEYVASLPHDFKYLRGQSKHILREAMRLLLPPPIVDRKKQGFILPFGKWFNADLKGFARDVLLDRKSLQRGYFDSSGLRRMLESRSSVNDRYARQLYALLMFEIWNRQFMDRVDFGKPDERVGSGARVAAISGDVVTGQ